MHMDEVLTAEARKEASLIINLNQEILVKQYENLLSSCDKPHGLVGLFVFVLLLRH